MQDPATISLNAVRVFLIAARHLSIKQAADEISVTPGAVSHQVKALEDALGRQLFLRRNNAIELTDIGAQLVRAASPGLHTLHSALEQVIRDTDTLRIRASMSFAMRWLIPKLHQFKTKNPGAHVELETVFDIDRQNPVTADVTIAYYRHDACPEGADLLFDDVCRPYLAPSLLTKLATPGDVTSIPALQSAKGNWDWQLWLAKTGLRGAELSFTERFDLDDAALRAACAGMGMVLTSEFMIESELADGRLVPLPDSAEFRAGCYVLHMSAQETGLSKRFVRWVHDVAQNQL